jgi:serine protease Do
VRPSWIGMIVQQVTPDMAKALGLPRPEGSIVAVVVAGGPAEKAGVRVGDIVLRYGDETPTDERALLRMIAQTPEGQTTSLTVRRDGKMQVIPITVVQWPRQLWDDRNGVVRSGAGRWTLPPDFGLTLSPLTDQTRAQYGLDTGQTGVVISGVASGTDAANRGLTPGDVILRVQDTAVNSTADVQAKLDEVRDQKRSFALLLVLPKVKPRPGAKWVPLRVGPD